MREWAGVIWAVILTAVVCWQGWVIKDMVEVAKAQDKVVQKVVDNQKEMVEIDTEQTAAILVLDEKVNGRK